MAKEVGNFERFMRRYCYIYLSNHDDYFDYIVENLRTKKKWFDAGCIQETTHTHTHKRILSN